MTESSRRMFIFLLVMALASTISFQGWRTLLNNFAVDVAGVDGAQMGIIQSVREIPGLLSLLVIYVLLFIKEHRLAAVSMVITGLGAAMAGLLPSFAGITLTTLIMSFGFHFYETLNQSLTLQYFGYTEAPVVIGRIRGASAAMNIAVGAAIYFAADLFSYEQMFFAAGVPAVAAGLFYAFRDPSDKTMPPQRKEMVFRAKYWLFYALSFLSGARRQIFVAFAVFLLVQKFKYSLSEVTALFVFNNIVNTFANPLIGRAVNRFGERTMLTIEYSALTFIFVGYALTDSPLLAGLFYILDNIVFNCAMAIKTYFQKIADREDIAPSMAVSFTINHIASVVVPVLGGAAWMAGYKWVFFGAAGLSVISLLLSQLVSGQIARSGYFKK